MKKIKLWVKHTVLLTILAGLWLASGVANCRATESTNELGTLDGNWKMVSLEQRGNKASAASITNYMLAVKGNQWTVTQSKAKVTYTFKLDDSTAPRQLDLIMSSARGESVSKGIYKLEGDTLTLCRTIGNRERPREFKTTSSAGILVVWQREGK